MSASRGRSDGRGIHPGDHEPELELDIDVEIEDEAVDADSPLVVARRLRAVGDDFAAYRALLATDPGDPSYRAAACEAIELAQRRNTLSFELEDFLRPFLAARLREPHELETLCRLADLYETNQFHELAASLYRRVLDADPRHVARAHLERVEAVTRANPTAELVVETVDRARVRKLMGGAHTSSSEGFGLVGPGVVLAERYLLESEIGSGATAVVWNATDRTTGRPVAIKVFTLGGDAAMGERFRREVELARRLEHPNIAALRDLQFTDDCTFIVMELLVGQNLDSLVQNGPLPFDSAKGILLQACAGLGYAHARGVIHRDVKSENLFLTDQGELKVMDFGMAKILDARSITAHGFLGGTPLYIAPEQVRDFRSVTHRADLYSLGVVAYELFTGTLPFASNSLLGVLQHHLATPAPDPRARRPDLPEGVARLILDLLAKSPEARPADCAEIRQRLLESEG